MAYELPEQVRKDKGVNLTLESKRKILGLNAARLYDIDVAAQTRKLRQPELVAAE
jgi:predicted TIM-barrel fold metal-dependent hydrolase